MFVTKGTAIAWVTSPLGILSGPTSIDWIGYLSY